MVTKIETNVEFKQYLDNAEYCLVAFTATWNGPCKMMKPVFNRFSEIYTTVKFFEVDVDELEDIASASGVSAMPTYMVFSWGHVVDQMVGASGDKLESLVKRYDRVPLPPRPVYEMVLEEVDRSGDEHFKRVRKQ
jgi:thioredoxin 1